mmetsp:Transcript_16207/g.48154  ORF Transcript_16207/g.48154 Transcript_16207/m.48154 type:complete len:272 (+) Transcript_16207:799-1614(+)
MRFVEADGCEWRGLNDHGSEQVLTFWHAQGALRIVARRLELANDELHMVENRQPIRPHTRARRIVDHDISRAREQGPCRQCPRGAFDDQVCGAGLAILHVALVAPVNAVLGIHAVPALQTTGLEKTLLEATATGTAFARDSSAHQVPMRAREFGLREAGVRHRRDQEELMGHTPQRPKMRRSRCRRRRRKPPRSLRASGTVERLVHPVVVGRLCGAVAIGLIIRLCIFLDYAPHGRHPPPARGAPAARRKCWGSKSERGGKPPSCARRRGA